jgi:hypothetical protein
MSDRGLVAEGLDEVASLKRSPITAGFIAGLKAALLGAPIGAGIQAARGHSAMGGAVLGGLTTGLVAGITAGAAQKTENLNEEAYLRYYANNIKAREPMFFMPPRSQMARYFTTRSGRAN